MMTALSHLLRVRAGQADAAHEPARYRGGELKYDYMIIIITFLSCVHVYIYTIIIMSSNAPDLTKIGAMPSPSIQTIAVGSIIIN